MVQSDVIADSIVTSAFVTQLIAVLGTEHEVVENEVIFIVFHVGPIQDGGGRR